ncbi:hypothetical protein [Bradyrhizobium sp. 62]|uniref:hypothetical protein n=1 Tax=Bradyrhizobium sp. 62 TaxID=1043588 RepID=UPI001FFBAFD1|nr:hypothetical protein [Bradyrhizobium sp. 62]MCK1368330.1 hypothetical protein [Bradyrhizobium sp. 62]
MPDAPQRIRVAAVRPVASHDGKDVTISMETDQNGTIEAVFSRELLVELANQLSQVARQSGAKSQTTVVPRRITVVKDHRSPDTFLQMEINETTTFNMPIGPRMLSTLIDGLDRARRVIPPLPTRQ